MYCLKVSLRCIHWSSLRVSFQEQQGNKRSREQNGNRDRGTNATEKKKKKKQLNNRIVQACKKGKKIIYKKKTSLPLGFLERFQTF